MSDRSWTIAPAFVWLGIGVGVGLAASDGDVGALANRLAKRRDAGGAPATGPVFQQKPVVVADVETTDDADDKPATRGNASAGALDDTCIDGTAAVCKRWAM